MSALFKQVQGDSAILFSKGVYRQADVYTRGEGEIFIKNGNGFVRVSISGATSVSTISVDALVTTKPLYRDGVGLLYNKASDDRKLVVKPPAFILRAAVE